ncbi:hypothetical protein J2S08_002092 [Bacillus chungangensis]|uniref:Alpha/beta hydrolase n=1 Tax=Bacillus chungangensis TaxID=587633 RepID=A0ABT9WSR8_9BACI|nr:hypothetical protein [Bacillus chungangensis]
MKKKVIGLLMTVVLISGLSIINQKQEHPTPSHSKVILQFHGETPTGW